MVSLGLKFKYKIDSSIFVAVQGLRAFTFVIWPIAEVGAETFFSKKSISRLEIQVVTHIGIFKLKFKVIVQRRSQDSARINRLFSQSFIERNLPIKISRKIPHICWYMIAFVISAHEFL